MKIKCKGCESNLSIREIRNQIPFNVFVTGKLQTALKAKGSDEFKKLMTSFEMKCKSCVSERGLV